MLFFELSILSKKVSLFPQIQLTTVFNIDNDAACFLSSKSAYKNDFEGSYDTGVWVMAAETQIYLNFTLHFKVLE